MSNHKKLYRTKQGAMLAGVCGGVAEYFDLDPSIIRLAWVVLFFVGTAGLWAYIAAAIILPRKCDVYPD